MNIKEYAKMAEFERVYWWHRGKLYLLDQLVRKFFAGKKDLNILEIGCGTGEVIKHLEKYGNVTGFDLSEEAINFCKKRGIENVFIADISNFDTTEYSEKFDLVVALDVLEHIQDDVLAMRKVREMLKKDGKFFVNVPAHKFLWSEHDEALHHKRRYHSLELTRKLKDSNFKILKKSYFVSTFFPAIVLFRAWGNFFGKSAYPKTSYVILPSSINNLLTRLLEIESHLVKYISIPIGTTLTVVAQKVSR